MLFVGKKLVLGGRIAHHISGHQSRGGEKILTKFNSVLQVLVNILRHTLDIRTMEHGGHFPFLWLFSSKLEIRKREIAEQMGEYSAVGESDFISFL